MRRRRWPWMVVAVGLIACAIGWRVMQADDDQRQHAGGRVLLDDLVPARAGVTLPPGTPIGAGFEVAEGSYLLGGALPYLYSTMHGGDPIEDDGFQAHLLATQPIRDVLERYRAQAVAAGFQMSPVACSDDAGVVACLTQCQVACGFPNADGFEHGRALSIGGTQGRVGADQPPLSHVGITYRRIGEPPFPTDDVVGPEDSAPAARGTVPEDWPPLPEVGEPVYSFNDFEVAPGTILLAHGLLATRGSGETVAIFEVVDDVDSVIDRFASQPRVPEEHPTRETLQRGDHRIDRVSWSDGRSQTLELHDLPDGPTILVLTSYVAD